MLRATGILAVLTAAALALVEGFASIVSSILHIRSNWKPPVAERVHTEYDELLGWINRPNLYIENMYGRGVYLTTNSQRFRNRQDFALEVPPGKKRIVCSGDSNTLGYGVDNDHTWCELLTRIDPRLESVNMGQGGYGIDQAYLWYERDGVTLDHDLHLFAFITHNFERMRSNKFLGYGRPFLRLVDGEIRVLNTPVPFRSYLVPWLNKNRELFLELRSVRLGHDLMRWLRGPALPEPLVPDDETRAVASKIFENLRRINAEKNSVLAVVYLPRAYDAVAPQSDEWRVFVHEEAQRTGMIFIDLLEDFRTLPRRSIPPLFTHRTWGHYTERGNTWVARVLHRRLLERPEIAAQLASSRANR